MGNQDTELGRSLSLLVETFGTGRTAAPQQKVQLPKAIGKSDHLIVLRDGRADHTSSQSYSDAGMGKGVTVIHSLQRQLTPDNVGPETVEPTFLQALSIKASTAKSHRFQNLYGSLNESLLFEAWHNLNKKGAPGVDKVTIGLSMENIWGTTSGG